MARLTAGLSKKRPGPEEFSSDCFTAGMEIEISDSLTPEQIKQRLAQLHGLLESEVDQQVARALALQTTTPGAWNGDCRRVQTQAKPSGVAPTKPAGQANDTGRKPISEPQQRAIAAISKAAGLSRERVLDMARERFGVKSIEVLTVGDASKLIDCLKCEADKERTF